MGAIEIIIALLFLYTVGHLLMCVFFLLTDICTLCITPSDLYYEYDCTLNETILIYAVIILISPLFAVLGFIKYMIKVLFRNDKR